MTLTPNQAYELYVGMVTVKEFLAPFNNVDQAIDQLMVEKWWSSGEGGSHPDNLPELIKDYVVKKQCFPD